MEMPHAYGCLFGHSLSEDIVYYLPWIRPSIRPDGDSHMITSIPPGHYYWVGGPT